MPYRRFVMFNMAGGALWVTSMVLVGYFLGQTPLAKNLHGIIVVVVAISLVPLAVTAFRQWRNSRSTGAGMVGPKAGRTPRGSLQYQATPLQDQDV